MTLRPTDEWIDQIARHRLDEVDALLGHLGNAHATHFDDLAVEHAAHEF